jgi:hypothetical protein
MAEEKVSKELSDSIHQAVQREVARVLQESAAVQVQAAERGIRLGPPMTPIGPRYVIYWTAA